MASRSQMRLQQLTGSIADINSDAANYTSPQLASAVIAGDLQEALAAMAGAIQRIHGESAGEVFNQTAGRFDHTLFDVNATNVDVDAATGIALTAAAGAFKSDSVLDSYARVSAGKLSLSGSSAADSVHVESQMKVSGDALFDVNVEIDGTLQADGNVLLGASDSQTVTFNADVDSNIIPAADGSQALGSSSFRWDAFIDDLDVSSAVIGTAQVTDLDATEIVFAGASGELTGSTGLVWDGSDLKAASAEIADLTATRVTFAGANGALVDSVNMTFATSTLTLGGASAGTDSIDASGDLRTSADLFARSGSFSGDLTVAGDLEVQGALTYLDTVNLKVTDHKVVIADGAASAGARQDAGIYIGSDANANYALFWDEANGKWKANDKFYAPELQSDVQSALFLSSSATGEIVAGTAADLVAGINAQFAGTNINVSHSNGVITHKITAGTGVTVGGGADSDEISIGQPVAVTDEVTFAAITGSNLTNGRLVLAGPSGLLKDEANFTYSATQMLVGSDIIFDAPAGYVDANKFYIEDLNNKIEIVSNELHIVSDDNMMLDSAGSIILDSDTGAITLQAGAGNDFGAIAYQGSEMWVVSNTEPLNILAGAELHMSGTVVDFSDDYRPATWSAPIKLADSAADWTNYEAALGGELSLLAGITAAAAGSVNAGKWTKVYADGASATSAGTAIALSSFTALGSVACNTAVAASAAKAIDVYVNGQLMLEGPSNDFEISSGNIDFSFDIEGGDVIQIVVR